MVKKKKILFHSDFALSKTGFGRNAKALLSYLYKTDKYELVSLCGGITKAHPELDSRTASYNQKLEKALIPMIQTGMLVSEAYAIVTDAIKTATEEHRKAKEIAAQQSMSGSVIAPPVSEVINKEPETEEEKFLQDALG